MLSSRNGIFKICRELVPLPGHLTPIPQGTKDHRTCVLRCQGGSWKLDSFIFADCLSHFWLIQMHSLKTSTPTGMCRSQEQSCQVPREPDHISGPEEPGRSGAGPRLPSTCSILEPVGCR